MHSSEVVDLALYFNEWSKCVTVRHQRDTLYRLGQLDDCSNQWKDFKIAIDAKIYTKDENEALKKLESTYYHKSQNISPTIGVIWQLKDKPGWY